MTADNQPRVRKLWLCADDYGISPTVNRAIRDLIGRGRINATSVMVTTPSFSAAEAQALSDVAGPGRRPAVGLHFTLTAPFRPSAPAYRLVAQDGAFLSLAGTFAAAFRRRPVPHVPVGASTRQIFAFPSALCRAPRIA